MVNGMSILLSFAVRCTFRAQTEVSHVFNVHIQNGFTSLNKLSNWTINIGIHHKRKWPLARREDKATKPRVVDEQTTVF